MSIREHKEFLEYLFTDVLKKPNMLEYYPEYDEHTPWYSQHLGRSRSICHSCNGIEYTTTLPLSNTVIASRDNYIAQGLRLKISSRHEDLETVGNGLHTWYELELKPECDSCKYAREWKKNNWKRYIERAIRAKERKELRKVFRKKDERLAIRKLLAFFNCNTTIPMRDSLSGVIDYMYPA